MPANWKQLATYMPALLSGWLPAFMASSAVIMSSCTVCEILPHQRDYNILSSLGMDTGALMEESLQPKKVIPPLTITLFCFLPVSINTTLYIAHVVRIRRKFANGLNSSQQLKLKTFLERQSWLWYCLLGWSINGCVCRNVCLPFFENTIRPFVLSVCLPVCPTVSASDLWSVGLYVCLLWLPFHLPLCLSVCVHACLSVCASCISIPLCVHPFISPVACEQWLLAGNKSGRKSKSSMLILKQLLLTSATVNLYEGSIPFIGSICLFLDLPLAL